MPHPGGPPGAAAASQGAEGTGTLDRRLYCDFCKKEQMRPGEQA